MANRAKWTENDVQSSLREKKRFIELEWDGKGDFPAWEKLARLNGSDYTKAQQTAAESHYRKLQSYMSGSDEFADYFSQVEYIDVWAARRGGSASVDDSGSLYLSALTSAEGLVLPKECGSLYLSALTSAEGLVLPEKISGSLNLSALTSAEGLVLPKECGYLNLSALTSAEGLVLPEKISGSLNLPDAIRRKIKK